MKTLLLGTLLLGGCAALRPEPVIQVRTDTVTVTRMVEPPLAEGRPAEVCLSTGVTTQIHIAANGDTLIGEKRIPLKDLGPGIGFHGAYAQDKEWFVRGDVVSFERRNYRRAGVARVRACDELKLIGTHHGVPLFAEVTAAPPLASIIMPVSPGVFQDYMRVR